MKKQKIYINLRVICGEYEFNCKSVHAPAGTVNVEQFADAYASDYYGEDGDKDENTGYYEFQAGCIAVKVQEARLITETEYAVLKKFL